MTGWLRDVWTGAVMSDPGLLRVRLALRAVLAVALVAAIVDLISPALGIPSIVAMLLGGMVGMNGSFSVSGRAPLDAAKTVAAFPLVAIAVALPASLLGGHTYITLAGFVVVMVAAVFVRRFGPRWFLYGMFGFFMYFFVAFIGFTPKQLPAVMAVVLIATACVGLVGSALVPDRPATTRKAALRAFTGRVEALAATARDVIDGDVAPERVMPRLHAGCFRLVEAALIIDAHLADVERDDALAVRRRLLQAELAAEELASAVGRLAGGRHELLRPLSESLGALGDGDLVAARRLLPDVAGYCGGAIASAGASAACDATEAVGRLIDMLEGAVSATPAHLEDYLPAVDLPSGHLPNSIPSVLDVVSNSRSTLSLNSRLCIQAAVAAPVTIVLAELISSKRYYWAVLACFLVLTGTFTTGEAITKGVNRVVGTIVGLGAATVAVHLTGRNDTAVVAVMLACVFLGLYFFRVSYAVMAFAVTTLMGELYNVLHEFSDTLLLLRVVETALGAVVAIVVVLLVLPVRTTDARGAAHRAFLLELDTVLAHVRDRLAQPDRRTDLLYDARRLDARLHQIASVGRPGAGPTLSGLSSESALQAIGGYTRVAYRARALVSAVTGIEPGAHASQAAQVEALRLRLFDLQAVVPASQLGPKDDDPVSGTGSPSTSPPSLSSASSASAVVGRLSVLLSQAVEELPVAPGTHRRATRALASSRAQ